MGPRLQERGVTFFPRLPASAGARFNGAALTRARSLQPCWLQRKLPDGLQWGRAYKSAELLFSTNHRTLTEKLQWGRAYKSAELK